MQIVFALIALLIKNSCENWKHPLMHVRKSKQLDFVKMKSKSKITSSLDVLLGVCN